MIEADPASPPTLSPVARLTEPDRPVAALPVLIDTEPVVASSAPESVDPSTALPLLATLLPPVTTATLPPSPFEPVPARKRTAPPEESEDWPPMTVTAPAPDESAAMPAANRTLAALEFDAPPAISTAPDSPADEAPTANLAEPDD